MKQKHILLITVYILAGIAIGVLLTARFNIDNATLAVDGGSRITDEAEVETLLKTQRAFTKIAEHVGPAVVSISTVQTATGGMQPFYGDPFSGGEDDFFEKFFNDFFGQQPRREFKQRGLGSGVIIDRDGHILTNEHVVGQADDITVTLSDKREFKAELKGTDPRSDLAIIKINAEDLPVAKLGDSDNIKIGEWAIAIGNPFGYYLRSPEPTITVGIVSALHRQIPTSIGNNRLYTDLIQTDAAINPGNSGGPLVNIKGEVVGINVAIFSSTGGYQGVGFAIPINTAKFILDKLITGEEVEYGWLGVTIQDITADLKDYFDLEDKNGALVIKVLPDSPADKAGLKPDDIILKYDGQEVESVRELINYVSLTKVGKKVNLNVLRGGKEMNISVAISKRPDDIGMASAREPGRSKVFKGIEVTNITPEAAEEYGLSKQEGVLVINVERQSAAYWAGIRPGDVIYSINKQKVASVEDFNKTADAIEKNDTVYIRTNRGYITIKTND